VINLYISNSVVVHLQEILKSSGNRPSVRKKKNPIFLNNDVHHFIHKTRHCVLPWVIVTHFICSSHVPLFKSVFILASHLSLGIPTDGLDLLSNFGRLSNRSGFNDPQKAESEK
jgi:hypothetical protein